MLYEVLKCSFKEVQLTNQSSGLIRKYATNLRLFCLFLPEKQMSLGSSFPGELNKIIIHNSVFFLLLFSYKLQSFQQSMSSNKYKIELFKHYIESIQILQRLSLVIQELPTFLNTRVDTLWCSYRSLFFVVFRR